MYKTIGVNELNPGEAAYVKELLTEGSIRRRLLDIGFVEETRVECVGKSPLGDPSAYLVRGAVIAIRKSDGKKIRVQTR